MAVSAVYTCVTAQCDQTFEGGGIAARRREEPLPYASFRCAALRLCRRWTIRYKHINMHIACARTHTHTRTHTLRPQCLLLAASKIHIEGKPVCICAVFLDLPGRCRGHAGLRRTPDPRGLSGNPLGRCRSTSNDYVIRMTTVAGLACLRALRNKRPSQRPATSVSPPIPPWPSSAPRDSLRL